MFRQTKFAVPSKFFPVAFADCSSNLVTCHHFISIMSLFQHHVARQNLPYQGLMDEMLKSHVILMISDTFVLVSIDHNMDV